MRKLLIIVLFLFTMLVAIGGVSLKTLMDIDVPTKAFLSIPLFLTLFQLTVVLVAPVFFKKKQDKAVAFMGGVKVAKILLSIAFILAWYWLAGMGTTFLMSFLVYYIMFIIYDSWMFMRLNRAYNNKTN